MTARSVVFLSLLGLGQLAAQNQRAKLDSVFAAEQGTDRAGCAVGVVQDGRLIEARGYGMADLANGTPIAPNSVFHVASVSKEFAAMSTILLAESGRISLDDDIRKYLPELPSYGSTITIRHLLNHTSGLRDQWTLLMESGWRLGDDLITEGDVLDVVSRQKHLNFVPGTDWLYSNTGFTLLGVIIKRVTGQSLREYAQQKIFGPLGMTSTHFHDDNSMVVPRRTRGYVFRDAEWHEMVPNYSTVGATSLFTTVEDLAAWHRQLDNPDILGAPARETLLRRGILASGDTLRYASGISHGLYRGVATISHSGGDPGYRAHLLHFPAQRFGVSVLCNDVGANPVRLAELASEVYLAESLEPVATAAAAGPSDPLAAAAGWFWSDGTETIGRVMLEKEQLGWSGGGGSTPLTPLGGGRYRIGTGMTVLSTTGTGKDRTIRTVGGSGEITVYRPVEPWVPTAADRADLVGRYTSAELGATWEIRLTGDTLRLVRPKFPPSALAPAFRDAYRTSSGQLGMFIRPERDAKGRITRILVGAGRVRRMEFVKGG
ncbi:MAG: serine hydrolase domain-containing protein [Gemmatimonadota bacterium]